VQFSKATAGYINVNHLTTLSVVWATKIVGKRRKQAMGHRLWAMGESRKRIEIIGNGLWAIGYRKKSGDGRSRLGGTS
jgi:hypothetical protein